MPAFPSTGPLLAPTTPVGGLPDLVVTAIIVPSSILTGDQVTFLAVVKNQGTVATPFGQPIQVDFLVDGIRTTWVANFNTQLLAGQTATLAADHGLGGHSAWTAVGGNHTIRAVVDPSNLFPEASDTNNTFDLSVNVTNPGTLPDLTITNITWPGTPVIGDSVVFTATVTEAAGVAVSAGTLIPVQFNVDGVPTSSGSSLAGITAFGTLNITAVAGPSAPASVSCTGATNNYIYCVDRPQIDITGDIDVIARIAPTTWSPPTLGAAIVSKWIGATNQRSWNFYIHAADFTNRLGIALSADGINTTLNAASTVAPGFADGTVNYVRVYVDMDNGAGGTNVFFYTSSDGAHWTQLGTTVTVATVHSIFNSTAPIALLAQDNALNNAGSVYLAQVFSGKSDAGGSLVASFDATQINTLSLGGMLLDGTIGSYASTPDSVAASITGDIDIRVLANSVAWFQPAAQAFVAKVADATHRSYVLETSGTAGGLTVGDSDNGTNILNNNSTVPHGIADGQPSYFRATIDINDGASHQAATFYKSSDYNPASLGSGTWTQIGSVVFLSANIASIFDGTQVVEIGSAFVGQTNRFTGGIRRVQLLAGIGGTLKVDFDPADWTSGTTWVSSATGETWTLHGTALMTGANGFTILPDQFGNMWTANGVCPVSAPAPSNAWIAQSGTHQVSAIVDPTHAIPEADETNNVSANFPIVISTGVGHPDLIVTGVSMSPPVPVAGDLVTFIATDKNQGPVDTDGVTVVRTGFYLDGNASPTTWSDTNNSALVSGTSADYPADDGPGGIATWQATQGNHTVVAHVNDTGLITETDTGNNTFSLPFAVAAPPTVTKATLWGTSAFFTALDNPAIYQAIIQQVVLIGEGLVRFDVFWPQIETTQGTFSWTALDAAVTYAEARNVQICFTLDGAPSWANGGNADQWVPPTSAFYSAYGNFCAQVAARYSTRRLPSDGISKTVIGYEIWNEPNNGPVFWKPSRNPSAYVQLLEAAYSAIKAADPNAVVAAGALNISSATQTADDGNLQAGQLFLTNMYAAGAQGHFDVLSMHLFATADGLNVNAPYGALRNLEAAHATMVSNGDGAKKIWATSAGISTGTVTTTVQNTVYSDYTTFWPSYAYADKLWFHTMIDQTGPIATGNAVNDGYGIMTGNATGLPLAQKPAWATLHSYLTGVVNPGSPFPTLVQPSNRYITDHNGNPLFLFGDAAWFVPQHATTAQMDTWLTDRANRGLNACAIGVTMFDSFQTRDGISLFFKTDGVTPATGFADSDFAHPNPAYFDNRLGHFIAKARDLGIIVLVNAVDIASFATVSPWLTRLNTQGTGVATTYGNYLATHFSAATYPNIIWGVSANDFCPDGVQINHPGQGWNALVTAIGNAIHANDTTRILFAGDIIGRPLDVGAWTWQQLSPLYTYVPPEFYARTEYTRAAGTFRPIFGYEYGYLTEDNFLTGVGTRTTTNWIRRQFWWQTLAGAIAGFITGGPPIVYMRNDTTGFPTTAQLAGAHLPQLKAGVAFLRARNFHLLVPDTGHAFVQNSNLGAEYAAIDSPFVPPDANANLTNNHYRNAAKTSDSKLGLVFFPDRANPNAAITVNMSTLVADANGQVTARWLDPTNGALLTDGFYTAGGGAPTHAFQPVQNNAVGDGDWVLCLETNPVPKNFFTLGISSGTPYSDNLSPNALWITAADIAKMVDLGVEYVRVDFVQGNVGAGNFTLQDSIIQPLLDAGIKILGILMPSQTTPSASASFASAVVAHYAPKGVHLWEWRNEPNGGANIAVATYAAELIQAYTAIKNADSTAIVLAGGSVPNIGLGNSSQNYLTGLYTNGAGSSFDGVTSHPYNGAGNLTTANPFPTTWTEIDDMTAQWNILNAHGQGGKRIWATEVGWTTSNVGGQSTSITEAQQPIAIINLVNRLIQLANAGVAQPFLTYYSQKDRVNISSRENSFGLYHNNGANGVGALKPGYATFKGLAAIL